MWFGFALGKEKIKFMFDNSFSLSDLELISFSFNHSNVHLVFSSKKIPNKYPAKWNEEGFNSLVLNITLSGII